MEIKREADLFPILKNSFKEKGFEVYAEVAHYLRGIDLVAVKPEEHIAVELKMQFNDHLVRQAQWNSISFDKVYIAYPVKKAVLLHRQYEEETMREGVHRRYLECLRVGIGIYQVLPSGLIFEALEAKQQDVVKKMDFTHYKESEEDVGGLPNQKGVSAGYYELESIKDYVRAHPKANWQEIFDNVHTHYAHARSLSGAMSQWRGFTLNEFKKEIGAIPEKPEDKRVSLFVA